MPTGVHGVRDHQRPLMHIAAFADAFDLRVQPQVGVLALQRALTEDCDLLIQAAAHQRDLVLGEPAQPHLLDEPVDLAGRNAV